MRKRVTVAIAAFISTVTFLSGCTNKYDKEIDKVISLETAEIKDAKKDIDKVERKNTCVKVFRDGELFQLEYKIRKDHTKKTFYKKVGENYEWVTINQANLKDDEKPVYKENCD
ncbi:cystatin-like fold lipoprotein [Bacillus cereus group sp. N21]|uniref:cystatin-like fold lipoprotein n=1 Tax=Bacillus cereus group sp. N21 TaxID=2794591 RepID=UPI0018F71CF7|nr:cystatin-like fold lipoprotein [Bacillus cereus group sp. N21]MBJ8031250.1 cystatin-like fold lipoprotein [Bacillus cereus group sp. N21]